MSLSIYRIKRLLYDAIINILRAAHFSKRDYMVNNVTVLGGGIIGLCSTFYLSRGAIKLAMAIC